MVDVAGLPLSTPLRVMVVDDERINRTVMEAMLRKMGHEPILANGGQQALMLLREMHPDMVLMDVMMPAMSGYDTTRAIRNSEGGQIPIIFLTALDKPEDIIEGLRAGADDYLHKPVYYELLSAKIDSLHERQRLLSLLSRQNKELGEYQAHVEDDRNVAVRFMERLSALERITDPAVKFHLMQAADFGGDLIAAARAPNGCLHVMLADSAGHGLAAALAIMPIVEPFYKMTAKGFDISSIVEEMNKRVRKYVSLPRYVAANVISLDMRERTIRAWNGGCPDGLVLRTDGDILHRFCSRHLPLGVINEIEFDGSTEHYQYGDKQCKVFMCSDGVTELGLEDGHQFDLEGMLRRNCDEQDQFDRLIQAVKEELHGQPVLDDVAMVCADCSVLPQPVLVSRKEVKTAEAHQELLGEVEDAVDQVTWKMDITLTAAQLKHLDVVPMLMNITSTIEAGRAESAIFMVLSELFNNALDHGVLKLDSTLKQHEDGMGLYYDERTARLAGLTEGKIEIGLERIKSRYGDWLKICLCDSGEGFDYSALNKSGVLEHLRHGRGLSLLNGLCDIVEYRGNGSEVVAYLDLAATPV